MVLFHKLTQASRQPLWLPSWWRGLGPVTSPLSQGLLPGNARGAAGAADVY